MASRNQKTHKAGLEDARQVGDTVSGDVIFDRAGIGPVVVNDSGLARRIRIDTDDAIYLEEVEVPE